MSRIGNNPIELPEGTEAHIKGGLVEIAGPKGKLSCELVPQVEAETGDGFIVVERLNDSKLARRMHGISRSLVENMVIGVSRGYEINLEVIGMGYKVEQKGTGIILSLGHSHQIYFVPPESIELQADTPKRKVTAEGTPGQLLTGKIKVSGIDKQLVGQVAAKIRGFRRPDVYKSKGVRYSYERVHIKAGKAAV